MAKNRQASKGNRGAAVASERRPKKAKRRARATNGGPSEKSPAPEALRRDTGQGAAPEALRRDTGLAARRVPDTAGSVSLPHVHHHHLRAIEPPGSSLRQYFGEVWRHRAAFGYFLKRFLRKRIGRTYFGYLWFVLPYVIPLLLGALVFGGILGVGVPGVPYLMYFSVTLGAWLLFSRTAYMATRSLEICRSEIRRLYVPRLIPLMAAIALPATAFIFYMVLMFGLAGFYVLTRGEFYLALRPATLLVPVGLAMLVVFAWALALWFSTLAPRARDVRRMFGYALAAFYFVTPVMYPLTEIPAAWRFLASLNPMTAPIEIVKDGWLDIGHVTELGVVMYFAWLAFAVVGGLVIFAPKERRDMAFY